jgi:hypothetical protein
MLHGSWNRKKKIRSRRMRWKRDEEYIQNFSVKILGKRPLGKSWHRWTYNTMVYLKEIKFGNVN